MTKKTLGTPWKRSAAVTILLICGFVYAARGYYKQERDLHSYDFKTIYASSRCLVRGCDPYDSQQVYQVFLKAGGPSDDLRPFRPHEPVYLPSALAMAAPFALLPWGPAHLIWLAFSTGTFLLGVALISRLCLSISPLWSSFAIGFLLISSAQLVMLAQPDQLAVGLCAIAVWCMLERRYIWAGIFCFAVALVFKPHVTGLVWLYFFIGGGEYRKYAFRILLVTILISLPGFVWASRAPAASHWMREIPANLNALSATGMTNDPGPLNEDVHYLTNLQTAISVFRDDHRFYDGLAHALGAILLVLWLVPVLKMRPSRERDYLALGSIVCISFLPTYHRSYDACLLLLIFPAFSLLTRPGRRFRWWTLAFTLISILLLKEIWAQFAIHRLAPFLAGRGSLQAWQTVMVLRPAAVGCSLLAVFYLASFYAAMVRERRAAEEPASVAV